jgi:hypothetical protein
MPAYINSPFQKPLLVQKGVCTYLIGSFSQLVGNTKLAVVSVTIAANVATVIATLIDGPALVAGALVSIINTTTGTGEFNVNRAVITGTPSYNVTTNQWTFTFALTGSNVGVTADSGTVIVEPAEVGESVTTSYTSRSCLIQAPEGDSQFTVPFTVQAGASITAMTATLQVALKEQSNEWTNTTTVVTKTGANTYTAGPVVEATLQRGYLYRVAVTAVTGTDSVVAKIGG